MILTDDDLHWFNQGRHFRLYQKLGAQRATIDGVAGWVFSVWAPNAHYVSVFGDFNGWDKGSMPMERLGDSGIWQRFVSGEVHGQNYKFHVASNVNGYWVDKADPFAFAAQIPPLTASTVWDPSAYAWGDGDWMRSRAARNGRRAPISAYEVHLGSWRRVPEEGNRSLSYREIAPRLVEHVTKLGFTHVELMPVMEHPFFGSWGYQVTGYFAASRRYGDPQDLMFLIDQLHRAGIGVILDWVPGHFPSDQHGLGYFDGTHLFEHADPRQGFHPEWNSLIFNYARHEVRSFLISNALFWLDRYHADGLRIDGVASMLYLDYARKEGEWVPNQYGGRENLDAVHFLRDLTSAIREHYPDTLTAAEDSTQWPMVTRPPEVGGLGFTYKWDMGWMHDALDYLKHDPLFRRYHHDELTFRSLYYASESFLLPLSHDEVVHGKGSLVGKMPGDWWQKRANLRLLLGCLFAQPGKKLLFMGGELAQGAEWNHDGSIDWHLLDLPDHQGVLRYTSDLARAYKTIGALHQRDADVEGFRWIDGSDVDNSVISFLRLPLDDDDPPVAVVFNFTPMPRHDYWVGVPRGGRWREVVNSDAAEYGGSGMGNGGGVDAKGLPTHGRPYTLRLTLPPLSMVMFVGPSAGDAPSQGGTP